MPSDLPASANRSQPHAASARKRLPIPSGRTLQELITTHLRDDGTQGLTARELAGAVHMAHETIALARQYPERLSMANLFDLAPLLNMRPEQLIADVFHELTVRQQAGLLRTPRELRALLSKRVPAGERSAGEPLT